MAPRYVRRKSLQERLAGWFNIMDTLLWISEEIETREWDSAVMGTRSGLILNLIFLLARANLSIDNYDDDDLFSDSSSTSWFRHFVRLPAH